ncbi:MAG: acyltransferase [Bryobacterales bacterium]|nr:acyltransferase [Bryobacterales bacterium]
MSTSTLQVASGVRRKERMPVFDVLRAAAAILVFLYHYNSFAGPATSGIAFIEEGEWLILRLGSLGTNLLLLLSGYFVAHNLASRRFTYPHFVLLRLIRIYIPYALVLFLVVVWAMVAPGESRVRWSDWSWALFGQQLLLWPGLFPEKPVLTVAWTLSYIVAGYVVLPPIVIWLQKVEATERQRIMTWAGVVGITFLFAAEGHIATRATYIPMGCLIYEAQVLAMKERSPFLYWQAITLGAIALVVRVMLDGQLVRIEAGDLFRGAYMGSGLVTVSAVLTSGLLLQHRHMLIEHTAWLGPVAKFGRTGYSFYLLHGPVVKVAAHLLFPWMALRQFPAAAYWLAMPAVFGIAAFAAFVLYQFVEVPCRSLLINSAELDAQSEGKAVAVRKPREADRAMAPTGPVADLPR